MLSIPELVLLVLELASSRTWPALCLLSRTCNEIVQPHIWKTIACHTPLAFRKIQPHIRNNAHHVETLKIDALTQPYVSNLLQELSHFQSFPNLTSLILCDSQVTLDQLSALLAKVSQLKEIDIQRCHLRKHPLEVLAPCKNIESMAFSHRNVLLSPEFDLNNAFSHWKRLKRLSITAYQDTGIGLSARQFEQVIINKSQLDLESLELCAPYWKTETIAGLIMRNSNLKRLVLRNCMFSEQGWTQVLPSLANLQSIALHNEYRRSLDDRLKTFRACPLVQHIELNGFLIYSQQLKALAQDVTALSSLTLTKCSYTADELRHILDLCTGLERLQVHELKGYGTVVTLFKEGPWACGKLKELVFSDIVWTPYGMESGLLLKEALETMWTGLRKLTQLRVLTLRHVHRTDAIGLGIHWFGAPSSLECLCLTGHGSWKKWDIAWIAEHLPRLDVLEYDSKEMYRAQWSWLREKRPDVQLNIAPC